MLLSELFEQLQYGELAEMSFGNTEGNTIISSDYPKIIPHVNLGITELYKRFPLKLTELTVQQYEQLNLYHLKSKYAVTNTSSSEPIKYIIDTEYQPFNDDLLQIESIYDEDGKLLYLNDDTQFWSIHTPAYNTIQVPEPENENALAVIYKANHERILIPNLDPETEEVNIPSYLLEALLLFIASRAYASYNSDTNNMSNNYMVKFENSCKKVEELGLINKDSNINERLWRNGWL